MSSSLTSRTAFVSILICTYNRAPDLRQTLDSLSQVSVPETCDCELLIVDNGSKDQTAEVAQATSIPRLPVRYLHEPRRGKGYAYNTGLAAAKGDIFLFTDDDVRLPQDWIGGMCAPILSGQAEGVVGGVKIAPHLERDWMQSAHRTYLASTMEFDAADPHMLIGANMAVHRKILTKVPFYDTELGPGALGLCEDSLFSYQFKGAGYRLCAALDVVAEHHFDQARLSRASFLSHAEKQGRSIPYIDYHWQHHYYRLPERMFMNSMFHLALWRRKNKHKTLQAEGIDIQEFDLHYRVHYWKHYMKERKRAKQYEMHGLVKKSIGKNYDLIGVSSS